MKIYHAIMLKIITMLDVELVVISDVCMLCLGGAGIRDRDEMAKLSD